MSSKVPIPPPGFDELSRDEQIDYVEALWDRIEPCPDQASIPDWHREILKERIARYGPDFTEGTTFEEFEKELLEELMKG